MKYEVQKQIEEINNTCGTLTMYQIPNMKVSKEELYEALKTATACMQLVMSILAQENMTMKELNQSLKTRKEQ